MALTAWSATKYLTSTNLAVTDYPFLVAAWCYGRTGPGASRTIAAFTNASQRKADLLLNGGDQIEESVYNGSSNVGKQSTLTVPNNAWYQAAAAWVSTTNRTAYGNGGNSGNDTTSNAPTAPTTFQIGRNGFNGEEFNAADGLAEVSVWDLTGFTQGNIDSLVAKLFNGGAAGAGGNPLNIKAEAAQPWTNKLKGYWIDSANTITDLSGNGNDLTMQGTLTNDATHGHPNIEAVTSAYPGGSIGFRTTVAA